MDYIYDAVATCDENGWFVEFPQFEECNTFANTRVEAARMARDRLEIEIADYLSQGKPLPPQKRTVECFAVCVSVTDEDLEKMDYMTLQMAADELGVSASRISHLIKAGKLERKFFDGHAMVSIESVNKYNESPRKAGRPKNI